MSRRDFLDLQENFINIKQIADIKGFCSRIFLCAIFSVFMSCLISYDFEDFDSMFVSTGLIVERFEELSPIRVREFW